MARPKLSAFGVTSEAVGFAVLKFGTALRLAWLPIVLLLVVEAIAVQLELAVPFDSVAKALRLEPGYTFRLVESLMAGTWSMAMVAGIATVLQASMAVALIRFATRGTPPHHRSLHLSFGLREIKYIIACAASFAGVVLAGKALLLMGYRLVNANVIPALTAERAVFAPGSLHSIDTVEAYSWANRVLADIDAFYARIGLDVSAIQTAVLVPVSLVVVYFLLRLIPLPFFAAARESGDRWNSLGAAWRLTGGWNIFPMLLIVIILIVAHVFTLALLWFGFVIYSVAVSGSEALIAGLQNLAPDGPQGPLIRALLTAISSLIILFATTFMVALNAGLGGALVHRGAARG